MTWRVHIDNLIRFGLMGHRLFIVRENRNNNFEVVISPTIQTFERGTVIPDNKAFMSDEFPDNDVRGFLQAMSDAAWEIGIKPKQLEDHTNELKAVRYHLEDMRQLAKVKK